MTITIAYQSLSRKQLLWSNRKVINVAVVCFLLIVGGFVSHYFVADLKASEELTRIAKFRTSTTSSGNHKMSVTSPTQFIKSFWDPLVNIEMKIPDKVLLASEETIISEKTIMVDNVKIFYRESSDSVKSELTLLLLHGMRFSSKTWLDLKTISLFTAAGYRTIAVDLPGFGNSAKLPTEIEENKSEFLFNLIKSLKISQPVIISPSFSGFYTLPLLVKNWRSFMGYIPVAPVGEAVLQSVKPCHQETSDHNREKTDRFNQLPDYFKQQIKDNIPDLLCIDTPTLVIHGEYDRSKSSALLSMLPNSRSFEIPEGQHPCYLNNPQLFHTIIYNFLLRIIERKGK